MPFHVALQVDESFAMDDGLAMAFIVAAGENEGETFDWNSMKWRERE